MNKEQEKQSAIITQMAEFFKNERYTNIIIAASKNVIDDHSDAVICSGGNGLELAKLLIGITMRLPSEVVDLASDIQESVVVNNAN
jgi:hypothetical protein